MAMDQEALQKRCAAKPLLFVQISVLIASSADGVAQLMHVLIGRRRFRRPLPPGPPLEQWLPLYRRHRRLTDVVGRSQMGIQDVPASKMQDDWREFVRMPEDERRVEISETLENSPEALAAFAKLFCNVPFPPDEPMLRAMLKELEKSAESGAVDGGPFDILMQSAEGQFYFRVWLPCWILYKTYPAVLIRRAREGCDESLERLVRLDKSAVADPVIAKRWHGIMYGGNAKERKRFMQAMSGGPKGRIDGKAIRLATAGLISQIAIGMNCPVTAPEIAELFDRIEHIRSGQVDVAIPVGETFSKAIQRSRTWPSLPPKKG